ncbi:MAG: hypothetical protein WBB07_27400 [Mycobacterium sp.]
MTNPVPTPHLVTVHPTPPPTLPPAGRTAFRAVLVIAAALVLLTGIGGLTAAAVGIGNTRVIADAQPLPASMHTLTIDTGEIPMAVRIESDDAAREPRVEMRFVSASRGGEQALDITPGPDTRIALRGESPGWLEWARTGELTVVVPPQVGEQLSVNTFQQFGVLHVDADLDQLTARNTGGAVILDGSARSIDVEVSHGAVVDEDRILVRESFTANVIDGYISVDFRDVAPRTVEAVTSDGDITLRLPGDGPFLVDASAGPDGTVVRVPLARTAADAESVITARSVNGEVVIGPSL